MMLRRSRPVLLIVVTAICAACQGNNGEAGRIDTLGDSTTGGGGTASAEPTVYKSPKGTYSVEFPRGMSDIDEQTQTVPTDIGRIDMHMAMGRSEKAVALVAYAQYPDEAFQPEVAKSVLDKAQEGALKNMSGTATAQEDITLDGHPGRTVWFMGKTPTNQSAYGRVDMYLVHPYFYQILYAADDSTHLDSADMQRFFTSFTLGASADTSASKSTE